MKMRIISLFLLLLAYTLPAHAEEALKAPEECQYLTIYHPDAANDAEYKPGVDVDGNPVVEADVTPQVLALPDKYTFDIKVNAAINAGLPVPDGVIPEISAGTVTIEKGKVFFNGKPVEGDAEATLRALCASTPPVDQKQQKKNQ